MQTSVCQDSQEQHVGCQLHEGGGEWGQKSQPSIQRTDLQMLYRSQSDAWHRDSTSCEYSAITPVSVLKPLPGSQDEADLSQCVPGLLT